MGKLDSHICISMPAHVNDLYEASIGLLDASQRSLTHDLLCEYQSIFTGPKGELGRTDIVKHKINTGDARPLKQNPRRVPLAKRDAEAQLVKEILDKGISRPSTSAWSSPIMLVTKKDGTQRFCVDYRYVKSVTIKDSFPLPCIGDTLDALGGSKWFSTLDLKNGYWQVAMDPEDAEKTAFVTTQGLFQFDVMAMGLCNAAQTFERLMSSVLAGLQGVTCLIYLDDVTVFSKTIEEHLTRLREVFECMKKAGLKLSTKKCQLNF